MTAPFEPYTLVLHEGANPLLEGLRFVDSPMLGWLA